MTNWLLKSGAAASLLTILPVGGVAFAQQTTTAESSNEVVVTARRREEALIDVPAAVSTMGAEDQDEYVIENTADLLRQFPSATLVNAGPSYTNEVSLRGQGGGRLGFSEGSVGVYRDGHYIAGGGFGGRGLNALDLLDVRRLEVLRGPQGALYGRNAVGGALNVVPNHPGGDLSAQLSLGYADVDRTEIEAIVNVPITPEAAFRIAAFDYQQDGGFVTLLSTGETIDTEETSGIRTMFEVSPTNATTIRAAYEYYENSAPGFAINGYRSTGAQIDPTPFTRNMNRVGYVEILENSGYLDFEHDFGWAELDVRASFKVRDAGRYNEDLDHYLGVSAVNDLVNVQTEEFERSGVIATLTSPSRGRFSWLAGVEMQQNSSAVVTDASGTTSSAAIRATLRTDTSRETLEAWSVFGAVEYDLTPRLALGLEARVQEDSKHFTFDRMRNQPNSLATEILGINIDETWTRVLPTATLRYRFSDDASGYLRVATGYRPGGFNNGIPADIPGAGNLIPYNPETTISYEAGVKIGLFNGRLRLDGAVYFMDTEDVQIVTAASSTVNTFILQNGVGSEVYGAEIEASGRFALFGGDLRYRLGLSSSDGEFANGTMAIIGGTLTDLSGNRVNRTRDLTGTLNLTYRHSLATGFDGFVSGSYQVQQGGFENAENSRNFDEFSRVDARIGVEHDNWRFSIYGKNLTDELYTIQTVANNAYLSDPRVYGAELGLRF
ncbi:MAG: TonB-dependent receptor [Hyphomonadaceae bacterium]